MPPCLQNGESCNMPYVTNGDIHIHYEIEGSGPVLVMQHRFTDSLASWYDGYVDPLKRDYAMPVSRWCRIKVRESKSIVRSVGRRGDHTLSGKSQFGQECARIEILRKTRNPPPLV